MRSNITIFATPKHFVDHIGIIQYNAIKSWTLLKPRPEIILFGYEKGVSEIALELGVKHITNVSRNELGTPLIQSIFYNANLFAKNNILVYINSDIILLNGFVETVKKIDSYFSKYIIIGQRWDIDIKTFIDFSDYFWEEKLRNYTLSTGNLHEPTGIDYFAFNKKNNLWINFSEYAVGRILWDNMSIYRAIQHKIPIINATNSIFAIHQNHDYSHLRDKKDIERKGFESDKSIILSGGFKNAKTIDDSTYQIYNNSLIKRL